LIALCVYVISFKTKLDLIFHTSF